MNWLPDNWIRWVTWMNYDEIVWRQGWKLSTVQLNVIKRNWIKRLVWRPARRLARTWSRGSVGFSLLGADWSMAWWVLSSLRSLLCLTWHDCREFVSVHQHLCPIVPLSFLFFYFLFFIFFYVIFLLVFMISYVLWRCYCLLFHFFLKCF